MFEKGVLVFFSSSTRLAPVSVRVMAGSGRRLGLGERSLRYVLPHHVEDRCADQAVLDRAREKEGAGVLDQRSHYVRSSTLEHVMGPFKPPWKPQVLLPVVVVVVHGEIALRAFDRSIFNHSIHALFPRIHKYFK